MSNTALYAGSFDPITNGHLNVIERASRLYDELTVAVVANPGKKPLFTLEERLDMLMEITSRFDNVEVDSFDGLLANYVNEHGFTAIIRGLRATVDFENEIQMSQMNASLFNSDTETVFLMTDPAYSFISSSVVKEVASYGGNIDSFVPKTIARRLKEKYTANLADI